MEKKMRGSDGAGAPDQEGLPPRRPTATATATATGSNGELAHAMGVDLDLSDKPAGLDVRSHRYTFLAKDDARWV
uniref:Uncharacterized protein n=1 Tax=Oryza rufipogon TaxID=4529 RepID=A0A0E0RHW6_ORYRU